MDNKHTTLNLKQQKFADEYIETGNMTKAAINAGYSEKTASSIASRMLRNVNVSEYIAERQKQTETVTIATLQDIQAFRTRVLLGQEKDAFGLDVSIQDKERVAASLEKALRIKEEHEAKLKMQEEARKAKVYHMDLYDIADCFHSVIRQIRDLKFLEFVFKGGRGSTKSSNVAQILVEMLKNHHDTHALVCRKVGNTLKDSVYAKIKWAIHKQGLEEEFTYSKSPLEITYKPTGQKIYFRGADDPDKIKSITPEFGYIAFLWLEELDQFEGEEEVRKIKQSALRGGTLAFLFESFNPPKTAMNWANKYVLIPKENRVVHHSDYTQIPVEWIEQPFIDEAEHLKNTNPDAYDHEYMGKVNGNGGMVFDYIEIRTITDEEIAMFDHIYQGADWGWYPDPYAFIRSHYNHNHEEIFLIDENYGCKIHNADTGKWIQEKGYTDYVITCDSEEPKSVADYRDMGLPARSAIKGPGSVDYGFKWLQRRKIVIDPERTPNALKEITEYEYERDKQGNVISGYPDENDHIISALRYSYEPYFNKRGTIA
jgi:phage terminase large subunit